MRATRLHRAVLAAALFSFLAVGVAAPQLPGKPVPSSQPVPSHWSFRPVKLPAVPVVKNRHWVKTPIDAFILAELEKRGLRPAPPASRETLIRRATFDLTGLPPTPEEIDAFLADRAPGAFARVVDRLLASPAYGQRWGRHWLDAVRYADARDLIQLPPPSDFREAWRYRDWVVDAFNRDVPYSEFISKQIAGDLMQPESPEEIDAEALVATGMLAHADFVPGDTDKTRMIADYVDDQIDVVGRSIMGLTVACARCHDHKFDPVTTGDYYALAGIFFSSRLVPGPVAGNTPLVRVPLLPRAVLERNARELAADRLRIAALEEDLNGALDREYRLRLEQLVAGETARYLQAAWRYRSRRAAGKREPVADFARAEGLRERFLAQWLDTLGLRAYPLLPNHIRDAGGTRGLRVWKGGGELPWIGINGGNAPARFRGATLPPGSLGLGPSATSGAAIAWESPVSGSVRVDLRVTSLSPASAGELDYALDLRTPGGRRELAAGSARPEGSPGPAVDLPVEVRAGELLELAVLPNGNSSGATLVDWTIRQHDGDRAWYLARDLIGSEQNGQHSALPDDYSHPGAWQLCETAAVRRAWGDPARGSEALAGFRGAIQAAATGGTDAAGVALAACELEQCLAGLRSLRRTPEGSGQAIAGGASLSFSAGDAGLRVGREGRVTCWPDRAGNPSHAVPVAGTPGPLLADAAVGGRTRPVLRFTGNELLQAPGPVPPAGSLFLVFRPSPSSSPGQRLVGWEDSDIGRHGLGLMPRPNGSLHAIARRDGASGDIEDARKSTVGFEVVSLTWGERGTTLHRNGVPAGAHAAIRAVTSDSSITALSIGGPGSGKSPRFRGDVAELRVYVRQLDAAARSAVERELLEGWLDPASRGGGAPEPLVALYRELNSPRSPFWLPEEEQSELLPAEFIASLAPRRQELEALRKKAKLEVPQAVVVQDGGPPGTPFEGFRDARVFVRGDPEKPGEIVPRGFPRILSPDPREPITRGSGRLELARWLTRPEHPLTARVLVNRVWQHHFGEGIVRTPMNFGLLGERPSHPELLDWLAWNFARGGMDVWTYGRMGSRTSGQADAVAPGPTSSIRPHVHTPAPPASRPWSLKSLHRLIMLSSTYQQGATVSPETLARDPENRRFGRMSRRRLEAEAIRDSMLAVAGRLDPTPGGPAFQDASVPRRTLYLMSVRTGSAAGALRSLLDAPDCSAIAEKRVVSTVAPQALFFLNDAFVWEQARALAARVAREAPDEAPAARIRRLYRLALGRLPAHGEMAVGLEMISGPDPARGLERYCHVLLCTNEFIYVD